jgi:hypothetical protein
LLYFVTRKLSNYNRVFVRRFTGCLDAEYRSMMSDVHAHTVLPCRAPSLVTGVPSTSALNPIQVSRRCGPLSRSPPSPFRAPRNGGLCRDLRVRVMSLTCWMRRWSPLELLTVWVGVCLLLLEVRERRRVDSEQTRRSMQPSLDINGRCQPQLVATLSDHHNTNPANRFQLSFHCVFALAAGLTI